MFEVQFYSTCTKKHITISKHRNLVNAIKKARWAYSDGGYSNVSILVNGVNRLDRYGKEDSEIL
jgi:hypothetical protein